MTKWRRRRWKNGNIRGVLVAISIPIFNSQLEKAREATDEANIRSIYAMLSADVLTGETVSDTTGVTHSPAKSYSVSTTSGLTTGTATYKMTQQAAGFANGAESINIGGVTIASGSFGTGTATITVKSDGSAAIITID